MKKLLSLLVLMTISANLWAVEAVIDGIKYEIVTKGKTATVLSNSYEGDIVIPETVVYNNVECNVTAIKEYAFSSCKSLRSVVVPNSVTAIGNNVFYNSYVESVTLGNGISAISSNAFSGCIKLTDVNIPETVTNIEYRAFQGCVNLASISFPDNVTSIGNYAFSSCTGLTQIIIGDGVTTIGDGAFGGCTNLTSVAIGPNVVTIGNYAFQSSGLTSVKIPNNVKSLGTRAFCECAKLLSVQLGSGLTSIPNYAFSSCPQLMSFTMREGIVSIGSYAFYQCSDLIVIKIPATVVSIGGYAFSGCTKLYNVELHEGLETISANAFDGCTDLNFIQIPNSVTTIWESAFEDCSSLVTVMMGSGMAHIYSYAFRNCEALEDVYCEAVTPPSTGGSNPFANSYMEFATLHVPAASVATYKSQSPWNKFKEVVAIDGTPEPEPPVLEKCATPTISYADNMVTFSCATEGVNFVYDIKVSGATGVSSQVALRPTYSISVYATKSGYEDSDTAIETISPTNNLKGDVDGDGEVDIADAVRIVNFVVGKIPALAPRNENIIPNPE